MFNPMLGYAKWADMLDSKVEDFKDKFRDIPNNQQVDKMDLPINPAKALRAQDIFVEASQEALAGVLGGATALAAVRARAAEMRATEYQRMEGRLKMVADGGTREGEVFETVGLQLAVQRLLGLGNDSPAYVVYCYWRAYGESLRAANVTDMSSWVAALGDGLLKRLDQSLVPPPLDGTKRNVRDLRQHVETLLGACRESGFMSNWSVSLDEDAAELWEDRSVRTMNMTIVLYGDPFAYALVLLAERGQNAPMCVSQILLSWFKRSKPEVKASAGGYYTDMYFSSDGAKFDPRFSQIELSIS
eukprot:TRINITY_DN32177_c0_g1_i3.p1 TRINITY_DN32177_c0_g1~~TRINITY_DN32177_c0_g1_i3.p1  ORF type:complete len:302 (+),score=68.69 TRINITY_DN32177_c0_g1_i3:111-1016(+)